MFQTKHLELIYQCFSMKLHFIIMYQINCIAESSSFSLFFCFPLAFIILELLLFYCSSSSLPYFLCFLNLLKTFFIFPQSQNRSSVSFCPQTLYLLNENKQSHSCQAISFFSYTEGKHWSMP